MNSNANRSFSNAPLRELNSISMTQKLPPSLVSPSDSNRLLRPRPSKDLDSSYELTEKKLGGIEGDRSILINRINKLQQEVDNLNKENSDLHSKLHNEKARLDDFQKKFNHTSKVKSLVDRNYQGDLKYEREENSRLKHFLHNLEIERNELLNKIKELKTNNSAMIHEKQEILTRLQQKIDHFTIIEADNRMLVDKIALFQNKMIVLEKENNQVIQENENLKCIIARLESQNSEVTNRIQEECAKYNNFVIAKNNELENARWALRRQLKIISAKSIFTEISKISAMRTQNGLYRLIIFAEKNQTQKWGVRKILSNFYLFHTRRVKNAFKKMASGMRLIDTSKLKEQEKIKYIFHTFSAWKNFTLKNKFVKENEKLKIERSTKINLIKKLESVSEQYSNVRLLDSVKAIMNPLYRKLKLTFGKWKKNVEKFKESLPSVKNLLIKSAFLKVFLYFNSWKLKKTRIDYQALVYKNEKNLREKIEMHQNVLTLNEILVKKSKDFENIKEKRLRRCILIIKNKELLDSFRTWAKKKLMLNTKSRAVKTFSQIFTQILYKRSFPKIRNYVNEIKNQEQSNLKLNLEELGKNLNIKSNFIQQIKENRLKRCVQIIKNKDLLTGLRTWAQKSFILSNKHSSLYYLSLSLSRVIFKKFFSSIKNFSKEKKLSEIRKKRLAKYFLIKCRDSLNLTFDAWRHYWLTLKKFRKTLSLSLSRKNLANLSISISVWKEFLQSYKIYTSKNEAIQIFNAKLQLEKNLESLSETLNNETQSKLKLESIVKEKGKKRLLISFLNGNKKKLLVSFNTWRQKMKFAKTLEKNTLKIFKCWNNQEIRKGWTTWAKFVKSEIKIWAKEQIEVQKKEKKQILAENKKSIKQFSLEIENREAIIGIESKKAEKMKRISKFLLEKNLKSANDEYSINKAAYFFHIIKQRYQNLKSTLGNLSKNIKNINYRRGLRDIKAYYLENLKISSLRNMLINVFKRYGSRLLRSEFDIWYRNTWFCYGTRLEKKIREESQKFSQAHSHNLLVKTKNREKMLKILIGKSKRNIFSAWKSVTKTLKKIKVSSQQAALKLNQNQIKFGLSALKQYSKLSKCHKSNWRKSSSHFYRSSLSFYFSAWKFFHSRNSKLSKSMSKIYFSFQKSSLSYAFSILKHESSMNRAAFSWLSSTKNTSLRHLLISESRRFLSLYIRKWKNNDSRNKLSKSLLKKTLLRAFHRKIRKYFDMWNEEILLKDTVNITNTQGPVAIENGILKGRIEIINKLMEEEGLERRYVEKYILDKENLHSALALQSITLQKYRSGLINPNDCSFLPKFFLTWKKWVLKRKKIVKFSHRVLAYLRKGELMKGFLSWKHGLKLIINTVHKLPRRNLFSVIAKLDMDVKCLENKLENTHKKLVYYETYSEILSSQVRRGQNMALVMCNVQTHKSLYQALIRWTYHTGLCKLHDLLEQLTCTEQSLYILKTQMKALEEENQGLFDENIELRQASLDGVAIAEAFETLSKERERLSLDLADRAATIQKLIDQNNELADRLRNAGLDDAPERDYAKNKRYN